MEQWISQCPDLATIVDEISRTSRYLWELGWAEANAGNLSVDVTDCIGALALPLNPRSPMELPNAYPNLIGRYFIVTGSGKRFRDVAENLWANLCILQINQDGKSMTLLYGGDGDPDFRPTSEFPSHLRVHEYLKKSRRPEASVLHTHPTQLIALTHIPDYREEASLNSALWRIHPEMKVNLPLGVGMIPYTLPGSEELALATVKGFEKGHRVVLWEIHGAVSVAENFASAFDRIYTANKAAGLILTCLQAGVTPRGLSDAQLLELSEAFGIEE